MGGVPATGPEVSPPPAEADADGDQSTLERFGHSSGSCESSPTKVVGRHGCHFVCVKLTAVRPITRAETKCWGTFYCLQRLPLSTTDAGYTPDRI